mgnify:CR=1 FL=1
MEGDNFVRLNDDIRQAAQSAGVRLWQIAEKLGLSDGNFSRRLRRELSDEEKAKIMGIIERLKDGDSDAEA